MGYDRAVNEGRKRNESDGMDRGMRKEGDVKDETKRMNDGKEKLG